MTRVAIIGSGNVGTDLLYKIQRTKGLECTLFAGQNPESEGLQRARELGVTISSHSIDAIVEHKDNIDIICDATSALAHTQNQPVFNQLGKRIIDLTPSKIGEFCIPVLNRKKCLELNEINMVTCGGQATIPIAYAISQLYKDTGKIQYMEIVACIASNSAGIGTRRNVDEFTQTTKDALTQFTGISNTKAIIILNPAVPEINMRNTLYCYIENPDMEMIRDSVNSMVQKIQKYVPGYHLLMEPVLENGRVTTTVEVCGAADYLPSYAGNLDIITCAALEMAKEYAEQQKAGDSYE